jgi:hypothetical protein
LSFSNLAIAMKQLHAGSAKPLPCGSAANYVSVSAQGEYFTCHRTIGDSRLSLGTTAEGRESSGDRDFAWCLQEVLDAAIKKGDSGDVWVGLAMSFAMGTVSLKACP